MNNSIKKLVEGAIQGNKKDLDQLIEYKWEDILYFTINQTNQADGKDIAQDVIIHIYKNISKLKDPDKFDAWMFRIIKNACIDYYRHRKVKQSIIDETQNENFLENILENNRDFLPIEYFEDKEKWTLVMEMIETLPDHYQKCIELRYFAGLSYAEIAELMDISIKSVTNYLGRGRKLLRKRLEAKTGKSSLFLIFPFGTVPIKAALTQFFGTATGANTITGFTVGIISLGIISGVALSNKAPDHADISPSPIVAETREEIDSLPAATTKAEPEPTTETEEETEKETEKEIATLGDMIGEDGLAQLLAFEQGPVDETIWYEFLDKIGAQTEAISEEYDNTYTMYSVKRQDKQLMLAEKKDNNTHKLDILYQFGTIRELPRMMEIILLFDSNG